MTTEYKALTRWTRPRHYIGADWPEYYVFLSQHRDSDALTRSNFAEGLKALGGESDTVLVVHEGHWAVGWVEWIAIHESNAAALEQADELLCALSDYPVLDDEAFSELEHTEAAEFWQRMSARQRAEYCREAKLSLFAARRDHLPEDPEGRLFELLTRN